MDPITQGALGASCAQLLLHKWDKRNAWLVGGLAGMAADLDVLIYSPQDPMLGAFYHRHFSHSLLFIPLGALLVATLLALFKRFRNPWWLTLLAALIGYATHGLLDACTNYGTVLFWPFSERRIYWDLISIIDPFFTLPLVLGVAWTVIHDTRAGVILGLTLAGLFLLFNLVQHQRALEAAQIYLNNQPNKVSKLRVYPKVASSTAWRGVARLNKHLLIMDIITPLSEQAKVTYSANYPLFLPADLPTYVKKSSSLLRDFTIFNWFSDGYLIPVTQQPLTLADGRYLMDDNLRLALWGIRFLPNRPHVVGLNFIYLEAKQ